MLYYFIITAISGSYLVPGCLQIQPNKFPGDFQDTFNKLPVDFLH